MLVFKMLMDRVAAAALSALTKHRGEPLTTTALSVVSELVGEYSDRPEFEELERMAREERRILWTTAVERVTGKRPNEGNGTVRVVVTNSPASETECKAAAALALLLADKGVEEYSRLVMKQAEECGLL